MPHQPNSLAAELFSRDPHSAAVAVVDGYGLTISVSWGHLLITDGIGQHRRTRRYSRAERVLRRIVILGHTGTVTLDAIRWCADIGIALVQIDSDGRILMVGNNPSRTAGSCAPKPPPPVLRSVSRSPSSCSERRSKGRPLSLRTRWPVPRPQPRPGDWAPICKRQQTFGRAGT